MYVKRVTVEEGFLHGLDLELDQGLTVLIGVRGSGKTSIVELIRFCLEVPAHGSGQDEVSRRHALAVLGSGRVTVTLDVGGEDVVYSRAAEDKSPRRSSHSAFPKPIVLSQNEIEQVGRQADSRLRLLDGFVSSLPDNERSEDAARALISSLTVELRDLASQIRETEDEIGRLAGVGSQLEEAKEQAQEASSSLEQAADQRARLEEISKVLAAAAVRQASYERARQLIDDRLRVLRAASQPLALDAWPSAGGSEDQLAEVRRQLADASRGLQSVLELIESAGGHVDELRAVESQTQVSLEDEARTLRTVIDELSAGAGAMMKKVSDLEGHRQRSLALQELVVAQREKADSVRRRRDIELDRLDALRDARINMREDAAGLLNGKLGPKLRVTVDRFGSLDRYIDALVEALRGSGVQYNILAPELARSISPRELAIAAETNDAGLIGELTGISPDRAQRVASHLRDAGTEAVLTAELGDTVQLALLDGGSYKAADDLSVGQRCTVVLPVILSHTERVLIVDQPEDNLDNSFVADTLVQALRGRPASSQMLLATHNPNIPVLGEADRVVYLTSDGRRGEVAHAAALDDPRSVAAITDIMEGGREAFAARAAFYERQSQP